jgi:hypothetical protein
LRGLFAPLVGDLERPRELAAAVQNNLDPLGCPLGDGAGMREIRLVDLFGFQTGCDQVGSFTWGRFEIGERQQDRALTGVQMADVLADDVGDDRIVLTVGEVFRTRSSISPGRARRAAKTAKIIQPSSSSCSLGWIRILATGAGGALEHFVTQLIWGRRPSAWPSMVKTAESADNASAIACWPLPTLRRWPRAATKGLAPGRPNAQQNPTADVRAPPARPSALRPAAGK